MYKLFRALVDILRRLWWWITGRRPTVTNSNAMVMASPTGPPAGVGLCLSGGGSRALTAGMGQLRALAHLEANGAPLLGQIAALSTVSGGSWLGVPWIYLDKASDDDYLNHYVAPADLVPTTTTTSVEGAAIDHLPPGNPGRNVGDAFAIEDLVVQMIALRVVHGTPWNMMWQILIARHLLHPYGLYESGDYAEPASLFSLDAETLARDVVGPNPDLKSTTAHLIATANGSNRLPRPFMICNTAMFVRDDHEEFEYLAPVQATPLFTGILGAPTGVDANGRVPGGGGVTSFAFSSDLLATLEDAVVVAQTRQWSLTDIVGASSAAFAETLQNFLATVSPDDIHGHLSTRQASVADELRKHVPVDEHGALFSRLEALTVDVVKDVLRDLDPKGLIPQYQYWPVADLMAEPTVKPTRFADGGSLENTGIAGMLSHDQIHSIIACVNAGSPLKLDDDNILQLSGQVPVLFGLQPYKGGCGYQPYAGADPAELGSSRIYRYNQVFEKAGFDDLLAGLRDAVGAHLGTSPAVFRHTLTTVDNAWFGVRGGRKVEVVWCLLNPVSDWSDQLQPDVATVLGDIGGFPNYSTTETQLSAEQVNLMSSQTAWCIANSANADDFISLFT